MSFIISHETSSTLTLGWILDLDDGTFYDVIHRMDHSSISYLLHPYRYGQGGYMGYRTRSTPKPGISQKLRNRVNRSLLLDRCIGQSPKS